MFINCVSYLCMIPKEERRRGRGSPKEIRKRVGGHSEEDNKRRSKNNKKEMTNKGGVPSDDLNRYAIFSAY